MATAAINRLEQAADDQDALGWAVVTTDHDCPVCGGDGFDTTMFVAERRQPAAGPLALEGYEVHLDDGGAYYHTTNT